MEFTPKGILKKYESETAIKSNKRFTYNEVQQIIESGKGKHLELITNLFNLSKILRKNVFKKAGWILKQWKPDFNWMRTEAQSAQS